MSGIQLLQISFNLEKLPTIKKAHEVSHFGTLKGSRLEVMPGPATLLEIVSVAGV